MLQCFLKIQKIPRKAKEKKSKSSWSFSIILKRISLKSSPILSLIVWNFSQVSNTNITTIKFPKSLEILYTYTLPFIFSLSLLDFIMGTCFVGF